MEEGKRWRGRDMRAEMDVYAQSHAMTCLACTLHALSFVALFDSVLLVFHFHDVSACGFFFVCVLDCFGAIGTDVLACVVNSGGSENSWGQYSRDTSLRFALRV
jgi:hypothetical protein